MLEWNEREMKLKPVRRKRIALRVSNKASYTTISSKAIEKWKAYQSQHYIEEEEYMLVFEDGKQAQFLPGTVEFFNLPRYHEEIGKDYKRIVLYLCTTTDITSAEQSQQLQEYNSSDNEELQCRPGKKPKTQIEADEVLARELQSQLDSQEGQLDDTVNDNTMTPNLTSDHGNVPEDSPIGSISNTNNAVVEPKCTEEKPTQFVSCEDLLRSLKGAVDESNQIFL